MLPNFIGQFMTDFFKFKLGFTKFLFLERTSSFNQFFLSEILQHRRDCRFMIRFQMFSHISWATLQDLSAEFTLAPIDVIGSLRRFRILILDGSPEMLPNIIAQFMTDFFEFEFIFVEFNLYSNTIFLQNSLDDFEDISHERKSAVWNYFLMSKRQERAKCRYCSQNYLYKGHGSTSILFKHLLSKHNITVKNNTNPDFSKFQY